MEHVISIGNDWNPYGTCKFNIGAFLSMVIKFMKVKIITKHDRIINTISYRNMFFVTDLEYCMRQGLKTL